MDQRWLVDLAADRTPYLTQAQSLNLFLPGNVDKKYLHDIHFTAWKKGIKSTYYCRSTSVQRADKVSHQATQHSFSDIENKERQTQKEKISANEGGDEYDECLSCQ
jgi:ribonucleoside-diphosphate reductase alpha chain